MKARIKRAGRFVPEPAPRPSSRLGRLARRLYAERRTRDEVMDCPMLREGAWDLLLDLYASSAEGASISVSNACAAACVPPTTALRLVARLEEAGLIRRLEVEWDRRVRHLELTCQAESMMTAYLERISAARGPWDGATDV